MATQVQFRGGDSDAHANFNGAAKEVTVDTDINTLVVHTNGGNGTGVPLLRASGGAQSISTSGDLTINTDAFFVDASAKKVGIGLTNPGDYHTNANALVIDGGITLANTTMGAILFADSPDGEGEYVGQINYEHANNYLQFVVNGNANTMRIDSSGRLLVGTTSAISGSAANDNLQLVNVAGSILSVASSDTTIGDGTRIGEIEFWGQPGSTWGNFASIGCFSDASAASNDYPGRLVFSTTVDDGTTLTEAMRINSSQSLLIGPSGAPATTITAAGAITTAGDVSIADKIVHTGDTDTAIRFPSANTVTVETNGSEKVGINTNGQIGHRETNPQAPYELGWADQKGKSNQTGGATLFDLGAVGHHYICEGSVGGGWGSNSTYAWKICGVTGSAPKEIYIVHITGAHSAIDINSFVDQGDGKVVCYQGGWNQTAYVHSLITPWAP